MDRGVWKATVHGVARVRHDLATKAPQLNNQRLYGTDLVNFSCLDVEAVISWDSIKKWLFGNSWQPEEKSEIMPFTATRMDLEIIILSEVSQTDKYHVISFTCGI